MKTLGLLCAFALLAGCGFTDDRVAGGTSSEVPNALTGDVVDPTGQPVAGVAVRVAASSTWADSAVRVDTTRTDSLGHWSFPALKDTGDLTVYLHTADASALARVAVGGDDTSTRRDTLRAFAWIQGRIVGAEGPTRVAVRGTDLLATTDDQGRYLLPVPSGDLRLLVVADSQGVEVRKELGLRTTPGDTSRTPSLPIAPLAPQAWDAEDYSLWDSSRTATIDLGAGGADVAGDHVGFPVPVRLDSVLDVRTVPLGEIRFDDGKGTRYPFEIETWDPATGAALAWVRLDTANGSSSKHALRVLWGRPGAKTPTGMPAVFEAGNGFLAAWHLGAATETSRANQLAWTSSAPDSGRFGSGQATSATSSYQTDSVILGGTNSWTVSLWARLDEKPSGEILLAGFRDGPDAANWGMSVRDDRIVRVWSGGDTSRSLESPSALPLGQWVHLSATFDAATSRIGLVVDTTAVNRVTVVYPAASTQRMRSQPELFAGALDELRLSALERAKEWSVLEARVGTPGVAWLRWN